MQVPKIMYEKIILTDGTILLNPTGIEFNQVNEAFNINEYDLPASNIAYSGAIDQFFQGVFKHLFESKSREGGRVNPTLLEQKISKYVESCLGHPLRLLKKAPGEFARIKPILLESYGNTGGLKDTVNGELLSEQATENAAANEARYHISEGIWQPVRRVDVALRVFPQLGQKLKPAIQEAIPKYQEFSRQLGPDQWTYALARDCADFLTQEAENIKETAPSTS
jgi:hypothetical protein